MFVLAVGMAAFAVLTVAVHTIRLAFVSIHRAIMARRRRRLVKEYRAIYAQGRAAR